MSRNEYIIITGGASGIGLKIAQVLASNGHNLIIIDKNKAELDKIRSKFSKYNIDRISENLDLSDTKQIKRFLQKMRVKKIIFASSSEAYGEPVSLPVREDGIHNPSVRDTYALTKLVGENMFIGYSEKYALPAVALRFFNVYGPRQESSAYGFVTGVFIKQVLDNKAPTVFGDGMMTRDFVYIDDNIEVQLKALLTEKTNGQVINVGMGKEVTILELANKIIRLSGKVLHPALVSSNRYDIRYRRPDTTKLKKLVGYVPRVSLEEGLKKTMRWYKRHDFSS